jgi:hypothetical protein
VRQGEEHGHRLKALLLSVGLLLSILGADSAGAATLPAPGAFELQGSNGYAIRVMGSAASHGSPSEVTVVVSKGSAYAVYQAPARATATSFEADLGSLGRVDVDYHPTGQTWTRRGACNAPITYAVGYYEGTIEFHGEGGYTDASATKVEGTVSDLPCGSIGESVGGRNPGARLSAEIFDETTLGFRVYKNEPKGPAVFDAFIAEASGDVGIVRAVKATGKSGTFTYESADRKSRKAHVTPPAPFTGSASFSQRAHGKAKWKGDLAVDFPGHPDVKLTGRNALASLTLHVQITEHLTSPHLRHS